MLEPAIRTFNKRDFANWLSGAIRTYIGAKPIGQTQRVADAFEFASLYVGRNGGDLAADLNDIFRDLPPLTQVAMMGGITQLWVELEFNRPGDLELAEILLTLACRVRAKQIVDVLPDALDWLGFAHQQASTRENKDVVARVRRRAFQAAVELATLCPEAISCLERFLEDRSIEEPIMERGQALEIVRYLALRSPKRFVYWAAIFGDVIVADHKASSAAASELRAELDKAFEVEEVQAVVDFVRHHKPLRGLSAALPLNDRSLTNLFNIVAILSQGQAIVADEQQTTMDASRTGDVLPFRLEIKGRG